LNLSLGDSRGFVGSKESLLGESEAKKVTGSTNLQFEVSASHA